MSESDIQQLVNAITTPNLVEKLMLAVTTLYLIATILVFLENKRMVKAAITASNISLFDKRLEILEKLQFKCSYAEISDSHYVKTRLKMLFPLNIFKNYLEFVSASKSECDLKSIYYTNTDLLDKYIYTDLQHSDYRTLEEALCFYNTTDNQNAKDKIKSIVKKAEELAEEQQISYRDPFIMQNELKVAETRTRSMLNTLTNKMERYIWLSIDN
ncbi:MAG: hypothetical protein VB034_11400 [Eubacteriales bacterium]|nr:hypothetical protein [Eubacteriales bacterium]